MFANEMKIPKNKQSRLADDIWIMGEAIARHYRMSSSRDAFEMAIRNFASDLAQKDQKFYEIWEQTKNEGIEEN